MTVGIVAITKDKRHIVVAGDRMLSHGDIIQATDDAALKASRISKAWGLTFAGDATHFVPIVKRAIDSIQDVLEHHSNTEIEDAAAKAYRQESEKRFVSENLGPLGYASIAEFKSKGLEELGEAIFCSQLEKIGKFDLGIDLLVYGFDKIKTPYIFQVSNPGVITNHNLLGCAAIGSGIYMATAALRRRPPKGDLETTIYRMLEAKFSSETATGVGRATTLLVTDSEGKSHFLHDDAIENIRASWFETTQRPDPEPAIKLLKQLGVENLLLEGLKPESAAAPIKNTVGK